MSLFQYLRPELDTQERINYSKIVMHAFGYVFVANKIASYTLPHVQRVRLQTCFYE